MKKMYVWAGFLLMVSMVFSCDTGKLTRAKAKKMIEEHYGFPLAQGQSFRNLTSNKRKKEMFYSRGLMGKHNRQKGVIRINDSYVTEKGKDYVFKSEDKSKVYMTNLLEVGEIKGISFRENDNAATVEMFLSRYHLTPFGKDNVKKGAVYQRSNISFKKIDDGWRIAYPSRFANSISLEKVPHLKSKSTAH